MRDGASGQWRRGIGGQAPCLIAGLALLTVFPTAGAREIAGAPGVGVAPHPIRAIRVLILHDVKRFEFAMETPFRVLDAQGRQLGDALPPLGPTPALIRTRSSPALWIGRRHFPGPKLDFMPERSGAAGLVVRSGAEGQTTLRRYPGFIRCVLQDDGTVDVVNVVDVEDYLRGVLRGEVYPNWHQETLKAQAIAARAYVLYERNTLGPKREWDVTATARSQMYLGLDAQGRSPQIDRAVDETRGIVCAWRYPQGDRIFRTYYSAVCGGVTQSASPVNGDPPIPPLAGGVRCDECWRAPKGTYRWDTVRLPKADIARALRTRFERFKKLSGIARIEVAEAGPHGHARVIQVTDRAGRTHRINAEVFRLTVDPTGMTVKSTHFELRDAGKDVLFTGGHGWGHGLGMCQWGAEGMARKGRSAEEILRHYYPGSRLVKAYD